MKMVRHLFTVLVLTSLHSICYGQQKDTIPSFIKGKQASGFNVADTLPPKADTGRLKQKKTTDDPYKVDSPKKKFHDPRKATLYSTFLPGLGQIYNKKYWKVPIVYAAVGIPAYTYFYNRSWYRKCQYAIQLIVSGTTDSAAIAKADPVFKNFINNKDDNSIRNYRNQYRKDQDYSVIFFVLFWGLQIVDATVDAHLKNFDISNELSLQLREGSGSAGFAGGFNAPVGVSLVVDIHKPRFKPLKLY